MQPSEFSAQQLFNVLRRRRRLLLLPFTTIACASTIVAFLLPRMYESSTTILVQRDEVLNPLVSFSMAVTMASDDRLKALNEVLYSQKSIQMLIDELGLADSPVRSEEDRQELIKRVRKNIITDRPGPSSVRIAFVDRHPKRAQRGVSFLCSMTINTLLDVENQRNEVAVKFFEDKLVELRSKFEESREEMVSIDKERIETLPTEDRMLPARIQEVEDEMRTLDARISVLEKALSLVRGLPASYASDRARQGLHALAGMTIPNASTLSDVMTSYDDLSRRYTPRYPEVQKAESKVRDIVTVMRTGVESELAALRKDRADTDRRRSSMIRNLTTASVSARMDQDKESSYGIYRKLYDEMKVKLEQARTTRDLGRNAKDSFLIIDPPIIPTEPTKPNRILIVLGGLVLGLFVGLITVAATEMLDTTVRTRIDIEIFQKPIVAFIPDGRIRRGHA